MTHGTSLRRYPDVFGINSEQGECGATAISQQENGTRDDGMGYACIVQSTHFILAQKFIAEGNRMHMNSPDDKPLTLLATDAEEQLIREPGGESSAGSSGMTPKPPRQTGKSPACI